MIGMGMKQGSVVCIHASMKEFYNYRSSAKELIDKIIDVITSEGTIMMPAFPDQTHVHDKEYVFDNPRAITNRTKVNFNVLRDKDGRISITVTCPGQHTESHYVDTIHPPITEEVRNQIIQTIKLMDENWGMKGMKKK